jgi:hypothetical protein
MDKDAAKLLMKECGLTEAVTTVQKLVADSLPPIHAKGVVKVQSEGLVVEQRELTIAEAEALVESHNVKVAKSRKLTPRKEEGGE